MKEPKRARKSGSAKSGAKGKSTKAAAKGKSPNAGPWGSTFAPRAAGERRYWLLKSEPEVFSFEDLLNAPDRTTFWNGVRNYAARNFMRDGMQVGDQAFYYHSMSGAPSIVGVCEVVREAYPDPTAFDRRSDGYDAKSDAGAPTWFMVDVRAVERFAQPVTLVDIKERTELKDMALLRVGRLSVSPVTAAEWKVICAMGGRQGA